MTQQLALLASGLQSYVDGHIETGSFLRAVLSNDLVDAVRRATPESIALLPLLVVWLDQHAPAECWGSPAKVEAWLAARPAPERQIPCDMHIAPGGVSNERCARPFGHPGPCRSQS